MGDFGKDVAKEYRAIKQHVEAKPIADRTDGKTPATGSIDPQVREQIRADLDKLIQKNEE